VGGGERRGGENNVESLVKTQLDSNGEVKVKLINIDLYK
jgi:hypothetical protein